MAAAPGLGFFQLVFDCRFRFWSADKPEEQMTMDVSGGIVEARRANASRSHTLGRLHVQAGMPRTQGSGSGRPVLGWQLVLEVSADRLEALERHRAGGDIVFEIELRGLTTRGDDMQPSQDRKQVIINQSDWAKLLRDVGYRDTILLEVPILSAAEDDEVRVAAERVRDAREEFLAGRYRKVMEACRQALEALGHASATATARGTTFVMRSTARKR